MAGAEPAHTHTDEREHANGAVKDEMLSEERDRHGR